jgi:hypothetical protein
LWRFYKLSFFKYLCIYIEVEVCKIVSCCFSLGREHFWCISCEKSRFYSKKLYFFPILGGARAGCAPPPESVPVWLNMVVIRYCNITPRFNCRFVLNRPSLSISRCMSRYEAYLAVSVVFRALFQAQWLATGKNRRWRILLSMDCIRSRGFDRLNLNRVFKHSKLNRGLFFLYRLCRFAVNMKFPKWSP